MIRAFVAVVDGAFVAFGDTEVEAEERARRALGFGEVPDLQVVCIAGNGVAVASLVSDLLEQRRQRERILREASGGAG